MSDATVIDDRSEFERRRNCSHCGHRLVHAQHSLEAFQVFTKRCPQYDEVRVANPHPWVDFTGFPPSRHDFLEHQEQTSSGTRHFVSARTEAEDR